MKVFCILLTLCTSASAKEITIVLTDAEQSALYQIFDTALRGAGMQIIGSVNSLSIKIKDAQKESLMKENSDAK